MAIKISNQTVIDDSRKFIPISIEAGGTVGVAGSVLSSTGSGLEWIDPPGGVLVVNDNSSSSNYYLLFTNATTGEIFQSSVSSSGLQYVPSTGNLSAIQFTSLSDQSQKTNVKVIETPIDHVKKLEGVRFNWVHNNNPSIGLIAQEVEKIFPELIETGEDGLKRLNYSSMIGLLIEAIKEQQIRIEELEKKINV